MHTHKRVAFAGDGGSARQIQGYPHGRCLALRGEAFQGPQIIQQPCSSHAAVAAQAACKGNMHAFVITIKQPVRRVVRTVI